MRSVHYGKYVRQGDIFFANLPAYGGHVEHGRRPVLIVQNNKGNENSPTTIVCAITARERAHLPMHVRIPDSARMYKQSYVLCEHILTIDKNILENWVTHLDRNTMEEVFKALNIAIRGAKR